MPLDEVVATGDNEHMGVAQVVVEEEQEAPEIMAEVADADGSIGWMEYERRGRLRAGNMYTSALLLLLLPAHPPEPPATAAAAAAAPPEFAECDAGWDHRWLSGPTPEEDDEDDAETPELPLLPAVEQAVLPTAAEGDFLRRSYGDWWVKPLVLGPAPLLLHPATAPPPDPQAEELPLLEAEEDDPAEAPIEPQQVTADEQPAAEEDAEAVELLLQPGPPLEDGPAV